MALSRARVEDEAARSEWYVSRYVESPIAYVHAVDNR